MNCNTCRYELSQCLDGRLPSGRRAVVMEHTERCDECAAFWAELQAAQRLTLQLPRTRVSADFRDSLWDRIKAGEGTPAAVFREPVQLVTKVRYALTGAAAAAIVLWSAMWLHGDGAASREDFARAEQPGITARKPAIVANDGASILADNPLFASTRPLTCDLLAMETAKQLEQRHADATTALHSLRNAGANATIVERVFENADELGAFAEVLLDMRDRGRLWFIDGEVEPALRFAVRMLGDSRHFARNLDTIERNVAPALDRSRLASVSRSISLVPIFDPREEMDVLARLNRQRPDVFPKLFVIVGNADAGARFSAQRPLRTFSLTDECGSVWVAPLSEFETSNLRRQVVEVQIERNGRAK